MYVANVVMNLKSRDSYWNKVSSLAFKTTDQQAKEWLEEEFTGYDKDDIVCGKKKIRWSIMIQFV